MHFYKYVFQNLTEFNTAHNRRISSMVDIGKDSGSNPLKRKHKSIHVNFMEEDEVINPGILTQSLAKTCTSTREWYTCMYMFMIYKQLLPSQFSLTGCKRTL